MVSIKDRVSLHVVSIGRRRGNHSGLRGRAIPWKSTKRKTKYPSKVSVARLGLTIMLLCDYVIGIFKVTSKLQGA